MLIAEWLSIQRHDSISSDMSTRGGYMISPRGGGGAPSDGLVVKMLLPRPSTTASVRSFIWTLSQVGQWTVQQLVHSKLSKPCLRQSWGTFVLWAGELQMARGRKKEKNSYCIIAQKNIFTLRGPYPRAHCVVTAARRRLARPLRRTQDAVRFLCRGCIN